LKSERVYQTKLKWLHGVGREQRQQGRRIITTKTTGD